MLFGSSSRARSDAASASGIGPSSAWQRATMNAGPASSGARLWARLAAASASAPRSSRSLDSARPSQAWVTLGSSSVTRANWRSAVAKSLASIAVSAAARASRSAVDGAARVAAARVAAPRLPGWLRLLRPHDRRPPPGWSRSRPRRRTPLPPRPRPASARSTPLHAGTRSRSIASAITFAEFTMSSMRHHSSGWCACSSTPGP